MTALGQAGATPPVQPSPPSPGGDAQGGSALDVENDAALEIAYRLSGIEAGTSKPMGQAGPIPPIQPSPPSPGGDPQGGSALNLENDTALEIAQRLVGIQAGRDWELIKARDDIDAGAQPPEGLGAIALAIGRSWPGPAAVAASCGALIAGAELSGSAFGAIPGAIFEVALASAFLVIFAWRPETQVGRLLPVLALVALIRPIGLATAAPGLTALPWYVLAGLPMLVGAAMATRLVVDPALELHLRIGRPRLDATVALAGLAAGVVGYFLLNPAPLLAHPSPAGYAAMVAILVVFGGGLEELIFRGLVQNAAIQSLGGVWAGVAFAASLSAALYWGSGSIPYMLLMAVIGFGFGLALLRGASLWGIALSHGLMLVTIAFLAQRLAR